MLDKVTKLDTAEHLTQKWSRGEYRFPDPEISDFEFTGLFLDLVEGIHNLVFMYPYQCRVCRVHFVSSVHLGAKRCPPCRDFADKEMARQARRRYKQKVRLQEKEERAILTP